MNDHDLTTLQNLDSAPAGSIDDVARRRSAARLQQILDTDPAAAASPSLRRPQGWRIAVSAAAAVAVAAVVVASTLTPSGAAYASWTPDPSAVSTAEQATATAACRQAAQRPDAEPLLVERRGDWIGVELSTSEPAYVMCVVQLPPGADRAGAVTASVAGGQGAVPTVDQFTGGAIATTGGPGFLGIGAAPTTSFNVGEVGSDITAVQITSPAGRRVQATVRDGHYFAWWPGTAFGTRIEGNGGPAPELTYRLTRTDGSTIDDARPTEPR